MPCADIPVEKKTLLVSGVELHDDLTLADCGIENGSTLKLVSIFTKFNLSILTKFHFISSWCPFLQNLICPF
jgi:hypothetical protein